MAATFRVYATKFLLQPDKVEKVVLATTALHNFLRTHHQPSDFTPDSDSTSGNWRDTERQGLGVLQAAPRRGSSNAKMIRDKFCEYFNNEGAVAWQEDMIQQ